MDFSDFDRITFAHESSPSFVVLSYRKGKRKNKRVTFHFLGLENFVGFEMTIKRREKLGVLAEKWGAPPKLDIDISHIDHVPEEELKKYCLRDAEICWFIYSKYFKEITRNGLVKRTLPSIAFYKLKKSLHVEIDSKRPKWIKAIENKAYYGGRCEAFKIKMKNVYCYDFNSLYPSVMLDMKVPVKFLGALPKEERTIEKLYELYESEDKQAIVHCIVEVSKPVLPFRLKKRLIFPVGCFRGYWCLEELMWGIKKKYVKIKKVIGIFVYQAVKGLFDKYVLKNYRKRLEYSKDDPRNRYYKMLLNAPYGKWAQRKTLTITLSKEEARKYLKAGLQCGDHVCMNNTVMTLRKTGNKYYLTAKTREETRGRFTLISAIITARARVKMLETFEKCNWKVVYCDTDSVFTPVKLESSTKLGELKLEGFGHFKLHALKFYNFERKRKHKGIPEHAKLIKSRREKVFEFDKLLKPREAMRRGLPAFIKLKTKKVLKGINHYQKGYVIGNDIYPLLLQSNHVIKNHPCKNIKALKKLYKNMYWI